MHINISFSVAKSSDISRGNVKQNVPLVTSTWRQTAKTHVVQDVTTHVTLAMEPAHANQAGSLLTVTVRLQQ